MPNQYKPRPPLEQIEEHIRKYWNMRLTLDQMTAALQEHFDTSRYQMGAKTLSRILKDMGLEGVRKQNHTVESISATMIELRSRYPNIGCRETLNVLSSDYQMRVTREVVRAWCNLHEPDAVKARMRQRFHRRIFYSAGVNHLWSVDQHDKWKRFHLYLHLGMDVFSRKLLWVRIWWSNSNPHLITSFFLDAVEESGGLALITQSDPGSENYGIANAQTVMRQTLDPNLQGSLQHRWAFKHGNIPAEIMWSQIRKRFSFRFENLLQHGVNMKYYNPNDWVHVLVFRWLGIPWLQAELDRFRQRFNNHKPLVEACIFIIIVA